MKSAISRMRSVQSPIIPVIGEMIKKSPGTISLGQGVVWYSPPPEALEMLSLFLSEPKNHLYKSVCGIDPLISTLKAKLESFNKIPINRDNCIVVTAGSNMAFMNAILAITAPGDEIILNTPYYFNHEMAIRMANCCPVLVNTDEDYQLLPEKIADAITPKTRAVVTISPNNPTGAVYSEKTLRSLNQICQERNIYHISDETYDYFTYQGCKHFSPASIKESSDHTISLYSLSKAYGFASWRIGYMVIPQRLLEAVKKVQDTILICPPVISQYAAIGALTSEESYLRENIGSIAQVRDVVVNSLQELEGLCKLAPANGAFYFFLKVNTQMEALELAKKLIYEYKIAVIPGGTFGMQDGCYLRVAYGSLQKETVEEGIERLVNGLKMILGNE